MSYKFLEHTADLRMLVSGKNLKEIFFSALEGMFAFLKPAARIDSPLIKRKINLSAPDQTALLVDFLNEVLYLANVNKEYYDKIEFKKLKNTELSGKLLGRKIESFQDDIKAVTYHEAKIKKSNDGSWKTIVIFDI